MTQEEINQDQKRLLQLWDGYEKQEEELKTAKAMIHEYENREREKDRIIGTLRELMEAKDSELRKFELARASVTDKVEDLQDRIRELEETLQVERGRYRKLYYLTEEMEQEVVRLRKAVEDRDNWFKDNLSFLEEMPDRIRKFKEILSRTTGRRTILDSLAPDERPMGSVEEPTFQKVDTKAQTIKEFTALPGLDQSRAEILYDSGYISMELLKKAEPFDLVKLEGITPTVARKITQHLKAV
jgi:DNA repair exonuclease SbcCD ATPase subunit